MKILALAMLLALQSQGFTLQGPLERVNPMEDFKVEPLSDAEIQQLQKAQIELNAAEDKYRSVVATVKQSHGETIRSAFWGCNTPIHDVQLRGHYAMISTRTEMSSCAVAATAMQ